MAFIKSKLGTVIDIVENSTASGAALDAFTQKATDNKNQQWEFVPDPDGSGCFFIKSVLSGNVIDVRDNATKPGTGLDAWPQKSTAEGNKNQLWWFVPDPAGSGYYYIRNALAGNVIDVQGNSSAPGTPLDAWPQKTAAEGPDNQLWTVEGGSFPAPHDGWTNLSWSNVGTGPAPNASPVGSGGTECCYEASVSIHQNGSCTFSGYYQNRGDVWWGTAPNQQFVLSFLVIDTFGQAHTFSYSGDIPSAPQTGSLVTWNITKDCPSIANNWYPIVAKNDGYVYSYRAYNESPLAVIASWVGAAAEDVGTGTLDVLKAIWGGITNGGDDDGGDDGGDVAEDVSNPAVAHAPLPPMPAGAPAGAPNPAAPKLETDVSKATTGAGSA
jgi:hypothetical protein